VQIHDLLIRKDTSERRDSEDVTPWQVPEDNRPL
jgi:hypothetical protein